MTAANGEASKGSLLKVCPWVTHERLDDEVIAINLETGAYFVLEGAAAECWTALVDGASPESVARHLQSRYDVTEERALTDSMSVLAELQASTDPQDETRIENLQELAAVALEFEQESGAGEELGCARQPLDRDAAQAAVRTIVRVPVAGFPGRSSLV